MKFSKLFISLIILFNLFLRTSYSENIEKIEIIGNDRISDDTIIMFSEFNENDNINSDEDLNIILKNIYNSNFFKDVEVGFSDNILTILVDEFPIIQNIYYDGIKANKIKDVVFSDLILKQRSSYNQIFLNEDKIKIQNNLKNLGYYSSSVEIILTDLKDNKIDLRYVVNLGSKAKIKKINFLGNKIFKDKKLKNIIVSEEYKFWKFISGKKYLNNDLTKLDERLLKNFYLNNGYYNVIVNTSFAKLIDENSFELIFNIDAKNKFFFENLSLDLPADYDKKNFVDLDNLFKDLKGKQYSINKIEDILDELDKIILEEQFESISANVNEKINGNKIDLVFQVVKSENLIVEKINIFGNNVTRENVIRNQFEIDEGDKFNDLLTKKTTNNLKNLGFFKDVKTEVLNGKQPNSKIINIFIEEKPTGQISAGAGYGTNGASVIFSVKENNYLGKGLKLSNTVMINEESVKGNFSITNPNYKNTDKLVFVDFQASETDRLKTFGYKTNKTGFSLGSNFEYFDDLFLGVGTSNFYENIETDSTASTRQKKQAGDYWDSFLNLNFNYDKRNQKFQTSDGYQSRYFIDIPIISDTSTFTNTYTYKTYSELYKDNISSLSLYLRSTSSLSNKDVKLSERIFLPSSRLRGFENGKVGPKDGNDFIGGNYATAVNFTSTIPKLLENSQNLDFLFFVDAANLWGVDYDSSLDDNDKIRSSLGLAIDWSTPIGPMSFTFSETLSKADSDVTESFRFSIGTTF